MSFNYQNKSQSSTPEQVLRGIVEKVTFRNPTNGYVILKVKISSNQDLQTVIGTSFDVSEGSEIVARGKEVEHAKFGKQFSSFAITVTPPSTPDKLIQYLGSGIVKGIGEKTAERIVEQFGKDTLSIIHQDPERIARIAGIGRHKAELLSEAFAGQTAANEIMRFLIENGISPKLSERINAKYKNKSVEILKENPYLLARDLKGVGFISADQIARKLGIEYDAPVRIQGGIYYALEKATEDGHCFLDEEELAAKTRALLSLPEHDISEGITFLIQEQSIIKKRDRFYLKHILKAEEFVAKFIAERIGKRNAPVVKEQEIQLAVAKAENALNLKFSDEQKSSLSLANSHQLLLVTGGPGCGKTTIIRALLTFFKDAGLSVGLTAPTGKAAQRMSQVCNHPASTIHRLLKYNPIKARFDHGLDNPLVQEVVIVDESSMLDINLAKNLFSALSPTATLILVGDKDQLPSVGPGRVFADLLEPDGVCAVRLNQLFRRAEESLITVAAHKINSGEVPKFPQPDGQTKSDAYFIPQNSSEETASVIEKLVFQTLPSKFGFSPEDIVVLTPSNRGPLGTILLNEKLREKLNPSIDTEQEINVGMNTLRIGDRVCQRSNNYNLGTQGVFNGDTGVVSEVRKRQREVVIKMWDGRVIVYPEGDLAQLSHSYALTVHRSQGSEAPCVVLAVDSTHFTLLERQLLYTAVTRAKKLLIIVGSSKALAMGCRKMTSQQRKTGLKEEVVQFLRR